MPRHEITLSRLLDGLPLDDLNIYCPIPLVIHPAGGEAVDAQAVEWLVDQGLCDPGSPATQMQVGLMSAAGTPFATEKAAVALTCHTYWAMLWEDVIDTSSDDLGTVVAQAAEANRIFYEPYAAPAPADKWLLSLRSLRRMYEDSLGPEGWAAVRAETSVYLSGQLWSRRLQHREMPPTLGEYFRMRWQDAACGVLAAFAAPGSGYQLRTQDLYDPLVRVFTFAVFYPAMVLNDVIGMAKEIPLGQYEVNMFSAMAREHCCSPEEALERVWELSERIICLMLRLQDRLMEDPRPGVARYAAELPQWIPAVGYFTATSSRYMHVPGPSGSDPIRISSPTLTLTDTPTRWDPDDLTPPPYPDIAWWWDQLSTGARHVEGS
ncbi:terpene synthase family protein [Nocardia brasiliensis]